MVHINPIKLGICADLADQSSSLSIVKAKKVLPAIWDMQANLSGHIQCNTFLNGA